MSSVLHNEEILHAYQNHLNIANLNKFEIAECTQHLLITSKGPACVDITKSEEYKRTESQRSFCELPVKFCQKHFYVVRLNHVMVRNDAALKNVGSQPKNLVESDI